MDNPGIRGSQSKISLAAAGVIVIVTILCRTGTTILTPIWEDALNENTDKNASYCKHFDTTERHVDPFSMLLIVNVLFVSVFGLIYICTKIFCSSIITERETGYDKKDFAAVGFTETLAGMFILLSSSGCRTAPYLQSLASNFSIPVTFFLRFLILRKRPTCRKLVCAVLVLIAEFTAMMPVIFPDLVPQSTKTEEGGAPGVDGLLWALCNFFGFVPMAIYSIMTEKIMKAKAVSRQGDRRTGEGDSLNTAYVLFWCYFFSLLSQLLLFWMDIIPGFGMTSGVVDFAKTVWFNIRCFVGYEGCRGLINYVSVSCVVLVMTYRIIQAYFVRHLEGANLMAMMMMIPTPLAFIFFTLFDENPLKWRPEFNLTTWLSIVALCIMIPAIYIYSTGSAEVDYNQDQGRDDEDNERRPLLDDDTRFNNQRYDDSFRGVTSIATQAGSMVDSGVQTSPPPDPLLHGQAFLTYKPQQMNGGTSPIVRERRVQSDVLTPRREVQNKYTSEASSGCDGPKSVLAERAVDKQPDTVVSSSWPAPEFSSQSRGDTNNQRQISNYFVSTPERLGARDNPMRNPVLDENFYDGQRQTWTGSDFNISEREDHHDEEDQLNPFHNSPYVEMIVGNQSAVSYNDPREPAVQEMEATEARSGEAENQLSVSCSPPSYTTLPKD